MKLFEIKNRFTGSVLFSLETESMKLCVEAAVKARAYLGGASLYGADLRGADLRGADLRGAYLYGANLYGADLRGADLRGADLYGADLRGADLRGADLYGNRPIFQIGPIGSRGDYLISYTTNKRLMIKAGCFFGTVEQFRVAIEKTHGKNAHAEEYLAALALIETHARIFPATENK